MKRIVNLVCSLLVAVIASGAATAAPAADVRVGLSTRETYVGMPVTLRIQVANVTKAESPIVPSVDGLDIKSLGTPSRSTQITTINGRTTTSTTQTFVFQLTPQRAGTFQIPPITVNADGASQQTRAIELVASKSETGDLMFVEITGKKKQIYVGQALDLTLKIWVRPYSDRRLKITLSEGDMWRLISDRTEWGPFAERLQQLAQHDQRPVGKETLRKDASGVDHSYYLYQVDATIYPKRPGTIDADNVRVVTNYPTALGRSRGPFAGIFDDMAGGNSGVFGDDDGFSPFGSQLAVQAVRPLVGQAVVEPINVLPIPTAGRPADYRGAVGRYQIAIEATPTHVKSGDPINLLIGVSGTGPMELVQAPPLSDLPELAADFKVPNEPLAGFVKGDQKVFSTSIRPRKPGLTQIPAIPFSYFDPAAAKFVTVHRPPVSIQVDPAEMLALDAVVGGGQATKANKDDSNPAAADAAAMSLANFSGDNVLVNETPFRANMAALITFLAIPPAIVFGIIVLRGRQGLSLLFSRIGSADRRFRRAVTQATDSATIGRAVRAFVSRQCRLDGLTNDSESVIGAIRGTGRRNLAIRCERLLDQCEPVFNAIAPGQENSLERLKREALEWLTDWQLENQRQRPKPNTADRRATGATHRKSLRSSTSKVVVTILLTGSMLLTSQRVLASDEPNSPVTNVELNSEQKATLLVEATNCYNAALDKVKSDAAEAKQGFADAADKYQLLVNAGIQNHRLYCNLANAYLESGQPGRAIANYLRCLRINPTMSEAQKNLAYAQKLVLANSSTASSHQQEPTLWEYASIGNRWANSFIGPRAVLATAIVAWFALWTSIGLRVLGRRFTWKSVATAAALVFIVTATSSVQTWHTSEQSIAVVIQPQSASPENSDAASAALTPGQVVELLQRRGDSVRIRTDNGQSVWIPAEAVETI